MVRITLRVLGVVTATAVVYALGPRYADEVELDPIPVFDDVEDYVTSVEQNVPDLIEGTEKRIVWAAESGMRTDRAIVYVHGFSATRQEVAPLCDSLAALLGANLFYTRLKGHGGPGEAMAQANAGDWLSDMREALAVARALGDRLLLIGSSTGSTLIVWALSGPLTSEETRNVEAVVLMSLNLGPADPRSDLLLMPWGQELAGLLIGEFREWTPYNEMQAKYWTTRYPTKAVFPMMSSVRAVRSMDPAEFHVPTLVAFSPDDEVVDVERIVDWYAAISSAPRKIVEIRDTDDPSSHILAGDILSPSTTDVLVTEIESFVKGLR